MTVSAKVKVKNKLGLHMRPSRHLAAVAKSYDAVVTVRNKNRTASADSQLDLLMLVAKKGTTLEISATGPQEEEVVDAIVRLADDNFGDKD